jgi:hypothetical protein
MARKATVSGSRYFAEIRKPNPNAETIPEYAGQQGDTLHP